jgi:hypothetical protein
VIDIARFWFCIGAWHAVVINFEYLEMFSFADAPTALVVLACWVTRLIGEMFLDFGCWWPFYEAPYCSE